MSGTASGGTIAEFLVRLGFKVDEAQQRKFEDALKVNRQGIEAIHKGMTGVLGQLATLATAATGAAIGLGAALVSIGEKMSGLGFAAERIGSTPQNIRAFEFAIKQMGGSAEEARGALEALAAAQRAQPGLLAQVGIKAGTDPVTALIQLGERWSHLSTTMQTQLGTAIHLSDTMIRRLVDPRTRTQFATELAQQNTMGLNLPALTKTAEEMHQKLGTLQQYFDDFSAHMYQTWGPGINKTITSVNNWLGANAPFINTYLDGIKTHFDGVTESTVKWWNSLSAGGKETVGAAGVVGGIAAGGAVVGVLSKIPLVGPLLARATAITAIATSIALLAHDYETWQETGGKESLIDWTKWDTSIQAVSKIIGDFNKNFIGPLFDKLGFDKGLIPAFEGLALYLGGSWLLRVVGPIRMLTLAVTGLLSSLGIAVAAPLALKGDTAPADLGPSTEHAAEWATASEEQKNKWRKEYNERPGVLGNLWEKWTSGGSGSGSSSTDTLAPGVRQLAPSASPDSSIAPAMFTGSDFGYGRAGIGGGPALNTYGVVGPGEAETAAPMGAHMALKANDLMNMLINMFGISPAKAAGIVANWVSESGLDPAAVNQTSGALGLMQWLGPRKTALLAFAKSSGTNWWDLQTQLKFWWKEFGSTEKAAGDEFNASTTPEGAAMAGYHSERPGPTDHTLTTRLANAGRAAKNFIPNTALGVPSTPSLGAPVAPLPFTLGMNNNQSKSVTVNHSPTINVAGVSDPQRAADLTDRAMNRQTANLTHHLRTAYA